MCDLVYEGYFQGPGGGGWSWLEGSVQGPSEWNPGEIYQNLPTGRASEDTSPGFIQPRGRGGASMGVYVASLPRCSGEEPERAGVKPGCGVKGRPGGSDDVSGSGSDPEQSCDAPTSQVSSDSATKRS